MSKIKFEDGTIVNFDGTPTPQDVEEVANQLGINKNIPQMNIQQETSQIPQPNKFGQVATGIVKGGLETAIGTTKTLRSLGQYTMAGLLPGVSVEDIKKKQDLTGTIFEGLQSGTQEARVQEELLKAKTPSEKVGKAIEFVGEIFGIGIQRPFMTTLEKGSKVLEKGTLRLSGAQAREYGKKVINDVAEILSQYTPTGNPEVRAQKIGIIYDSFEKTFQGFLDTTAKGFNASKTEIINKLNNLKTKYRGDRDYESILKQVDDVIDLFKTRYKEKISLSRLNEFKRSTFKDAFNKAGTKVRDDVEFAIGEITKNEIERVGKINNLKISGQDIGAFNQEYRKIIQTHRLLKEAIGKPEIGMLGKILGFTAGGAVGGSAGGVFGATTGMYLGSKAAQTLGGTTAKSTLSYLLKKTAEKGETARGFLSGMFK